MSIRISSNPIFKAERPILSQQNTDKKESYKKENVVLGGLVALGVAAAVVLALRNKKTKTDIVKVKELAVEKQKVKNMTDAEKEKLIRELQAKTENPETKAEIRKLIESGEWDKLGTNGDK